jgi:putative phage-type endonuclease
MLTTEQLAIRKQGITGSEIAAIIGISPYSSPLEVWARKLGLIEDVQPSEAMDRGTYLERGIRDWYAAKTGATVTEVGTLVHPDHPLVIATPDGRAVKGDDARALEIKAPTIWTMRQWGEPGGDDIPDHYIPQATWEAACLGLPRTDVAADLGDRLGIWTVDFDPALFAMLLERAEKFWRDHILTRIAPEAQGLPGEDTVIKALYPSSKTTEQVAADEALCEMVGKFRAAKEALETAEQECDGWKNRLKQAIGNKAGISGPFGRIDYKNNKPSIKTDWEAVARELSAPDVIIAKHTTEKPGARPFKPYWKKG